jgi:hypothetical protein
MILFIFVLLFLLAACWAQGSWSGADYDGKTPGPYRSDCENEHYWRGQSQAKRNRTNRLLEEAGDSRRV